MTTPPTTLAALRESGWTSRPVKHEIRDNLARMLGAGETLFPGILGYDDTVIPEIANAVLAGHDMLFLGEKGQGKSRIMRMLTRFLDEHVPYLDIPGSPVHEDPAHPITAAGKRMLADLAPEEVPIRWWHRDDRYAERLSPGTKFADIIGEIDPARLLSGSSMSAEESLHFGLIPRMHRGIFAMNEVPDLDELVQTGLFNILEERDVQIRGYPVSFDIDVLRPLQRQPADVQPLGQGHPAAQGPDRHDHPDPLPARAATSALRSWCRSPTSKSTGRYPVVIPRFMAGARASRWPSAARQSKFVDQASGVSARFSHRQLPHHGRLAPGSRAIRLGESPAVPRISDLAHFARLQPSASSNWT